MTTYHRSKGLGKVVLSINMSGEMICVDFFERPNGTFGFEEYRHDVESGEGWFPIGFHSGRVFETIGQARSAGLKTVAWLETEL